MLNPCSLETLQPKIVSIRFDGRFLRISTICQKARLGSGLWLNALKKSKHLYTCVAPTLRVKYPERYIWVLIRLHQVRVRVGSMSKIVQDGGRLRLKSLVFTCFHQMGQNPQDLIESLGASRGWPLTLVTLVTWKAAIGHDIHHHMQCHCNMKLNETFPDKVSFVYWDVCCWDNGTDSVVFLESVCDFNDFLSVWSWYNEDGVHGIHR